VNVSGLTEGGFTSFNPNVPPPLGTVGNDPVKVLVVYLPEGGTNGNGSGAVIDAFDETLGRLIDDDFVTVSVNGSNNAALTNSGNVDGWADTSQSGATIMAYSDVSLVYEGMPAIHAGFNKWVNLEDGSSPIGLNLNINQGQTIYAFAFYQNISGKRTKEIEYGPLKLAGKEKDGKEIVEFGSWVNEVYDPAYLVAGIQRLNTAIAALEIKIDTAIRGRSFIKQEERPEVGKFSSGNTDRG
jgi:hypothetical protein